MATTAGRVGGGDDLGAFAELTREFVVLEE